ncbi:MAG: hypothetical protein Q4C75_04290 [Bergeyella zoohelcum]|nr:hypothetical protein [Bergeyella zoohelcum]
MAKSINNIITHGLSGKVGDLLVFRQVDGKTIVAKVPKKSNKVTDKQLEQRAKFQEATIYTKSVMQNENLKTQYEEEAKNKGLKVNNIAIADFLKAPKIEEVDLSNYTGKRNDLIKIKAFDDFKVERVSVKIENADGSLVEEGNATQEGLYWIYKAKENNADLSGDKITVRAYDLPDNMTEKEQVL